MTKYLQVIEGAQPAKNKQARELVEYCVHKFGYGKFPKKEFLVELKDLTPKDGATSADSVDVPLRASKANPALTFNYYLPGLRVYGHMKLYEDDVLLDPKLGGIDPFNRVKSKNATKRTSPSKGMSLTDELKFLQDRMAVDRARVVAIGEAMKAALATAEQVLDDTIVAGDGSEELSEDGEMTDEELEAATDPDQE